MNFTKALSITQSGDRLAEGYGFRITRSNLKMIQMKKK